MPRVQLVGQADQAKQLQAGVPTTDDWDAGGEQHSSTRAASSQWRLASRLDPSTVH